MEVWWLQSLCSLEKFGGVAKADKPRSQGSFAILVRGAKHSGGPEPTTISIPSPCGRVGVVSWVGLNLANHRAPSPYSQ